MKSLISKILVATLIISILPLSSAFAETPQEEVVRIAKEQLGVPYVFGGSSPSGFDCSGFVYYVFSKVDIELPRRSQDQYEVGKAVSKDDLKAGDTVFFERTYNKSGITHAGIYIGDNKFISATSSSGIKIDSLSDSYWGPKYVGAKRLIDAPAPGEFYDLTKDHPAYIAVQTLNEQNIIKGFEDQTFLPDNPVTRGQAAVIINRVLKKEAKDLKAFRDVAPSYQFARDIAAVKEAGIISGFSDGTFRPNDYMTRAEMAVIMNRAFELSNKHTLTSAKNVYEDISPDYWAYDSIIALYNIDTTSIFRENKFNSSSKATRAVFSAAIFNSMKVSK